MTDTTSGAKRFRIATLAPGHFHAALIQKQSLPELAEEAFVYAPLGPDLAAHLNRIAGFNARKDNPTNWKLRVYAAPDFQERMLAERPADMVVLSGVNRGKIDRIGACVAAGLHVLADKPWIIDSAGLPRLEVALETAARNNVVAYDAMTQRFEISAIVNRELVSDAEIFGEPLPGFPEEPSVYMDSVHHLLKLVAGAPNLRPAWFFDIRQQGEGLADAGTHLVDMVQWVLFPGQSIDHRRDIRVLRGSRWPTVISEAAFQRVTGERQFPEYLREWICPEGLQYYCNNSVTYSIRGVHVKLDVKWDYEAPPGGGDTETAIFRGSRATVEVRQGREENFRPEVFVTPRPGLESQVAAAVARRVTELQAPWPGLGAEEQPGRLRILIPDAHRVGHEAHFALLTGRFLQYAKNPGALPSWETPAMLSKYYVTTEGVRLALEENR